MRPFTSTISIDEARERLAANVQPMARTERVPLTHATGRVAATDLVASIFVPPFSRSAMDGYAVVAADTAGATQAAPVRLRVLERVFTGQTPTAALVAGTCAEIATGAPLPDGANAVVMVEDTSRLDDEHVAIAARVAVGQNIGRHGADISPGDIVVRQGDLLNPSRIGAVAAVGGFDVEVFAQPRVAVLSTGNEVVEPGIPLDGAQIYDVNRFTLGAVVSAHGGVPVTYAPAGDSMIALEAALDMCKGTDMVIFSGGSSVGDRDLVVDLVEKRGTMIFHGIAVKPGKPTAFALVDGVPFFGMPGNPTSCLSNAYILIVPFLRAMARLPLYAPRTLSARIDKRIVSQAGRHQFYTVRVRDEVASPAFKSSNDITSLSRADGYIEIPSDQSTVEEGTTVTVTLF
jgi:molybdopterin molybdotransferase